MTVSDLERRDASIGAGAIELARARAPPQKKKNK